ncbi:tape measure protein [Shewanella sp. 3B26]|uniref:Tape measure protein n=1 Tax=Shewanella zhuhaiensis TaxID=2919576 RepID=A0AAJ1BIU1_9GAMM|nr:tape measure protein [Shewanella zhuhaiensis]MCH4295568.1 tape measure protein [Shewanella zhuhaiensis]
MSNTSLELALRIVAEATGKQSIEALVAELLRVGETSDSVNPKAKALANEIDELGNQQELINSFKASRNALEEQELALTAAAMSLEELRRKAERTDEPFTQLARSIDSAEKELEQMQQELAEQSASHTRLQQALSKSGIDYNNLGIAQRKLGVGFDDAGRKVDRFTKELDEGDAQARASAEGLRGVVAQVTALAAAYVGFDRVAQAVKDVFTTGDQFERLGVQFQALMGSIEGGKQATAWVKEFAKNTPLQLEEVSQVFVKLKAFGLDPMNGSMQAVVDQALKLGGSFQEVEGIALALGQAWAKQKLQGEEILQLVERGVPVWDMLANITGKNTQELQKLSEQGKLGRDVIQQLMDEMGRSSAGSAAAQMALLSGQVSNLQDNLSQFYDLVAQSGALDWLKSQLSELNAEFAVMATDGRLKEWAQAFSDTIVSAGAAIKDVMGLLYDYREEIGFVAKAWLALKVGSYFSDVVVGAQAAMVAMRSYTAVIAGTAAATDAATLAAGKWKTALAAVGRAGLYLWLIEELVTVGFAYKDMLVAQEAQAKSEREAAASTKEKAERLKELSEETGIAISTMAEFHEAEEKGLIIYDEAIGKYKAAAKAVEEIADAADTATAALATMSEPIRITVDEALKLTDTLSRQAGSLDNLKGGMGGFIRMVDVALVSLKDAGDEYRAHVSLLEELKGKFEAQQTYLDAVAQGTEALEAAYKELGITSANSLQDTAEKSRVAFELIRDAKEPVDKVRDAFIQYARAAIVAAEANGKAVPDSLKMQAAALQLSEEFDKLTRKQQQYGETVKGLTPEHNRLAKELENTRENLALSRNEMNSSTASEKDKAEATKRHWELQKKLGEQTQALTEIQALEAANYSQLKAKYEAVSDELLRLEKAYQDNGITAAEYLEQKERLGNVLSVLQRLMGGYSDAQKNAAKAASQATKTLAEQREELERLQQTTGRAVEYVNLFAGAFEHLNKKFNFSADSTERLTARQDELTDMIIRNSRVTTGFWGELAKLSNQGFIRERQIISETLSIRRWTEQLASSGITLQQIDAIAKASRLQIRTLGEEDLKPLQSAIDAARQKLKDLRDDIQGTVRDLQDELDQLNDNQAAIEKRRYQQQQRDLQDKLKAAEKAQDREAMAAASEALRLAEEVYRVKQKQAAADKAEREQRERETRSGAAAKTVSQAPTQQAAAGAGISAPGAALASGGAQNVVRLELVMPSGRMIEAEVFGQFGEQLLAELERIKGAS